MTHFQRGVVDRQEAHDELTGTGYGFAGVELAVPRWVVTGRLDREHRLAISLSCAASCAAELRRGSDAGPYGERLEALADP